MDPSPRNRRWRTALAVGWAEPWSLVPRIRLRVALRGASVHETAGGAGGEAKSWTGSPRPPATRRRRGVATPDPSHERMIAHAPRDRHRQHQHHARPRARAARSSPRAAPATPPRPPRPDELELLLDGLLAPRRARPRRRLGDRVLASVVPALTAAVEAVAARRGVPLLVATAGTVPARRPRGPPGRGRRRTGSSTPWPPRGCTARRPSSWTSGTATTFDCVGRRRRVRRRRDRARASSSASRRSPRAPRSCRGSSCGRRTGRSAATRSARCRAAPSSATRRWSTGLLARIRARARASSRRRPSSDVHAILTGGLSRGAVGRATRGRRRHRPRPDAQGPRHPPRRGRAAASRCELGPARDGERGRPLEGRLDRRSASPARSPPTRPSSCCALLRAEGADVVVDAHPVGDPVRRAADVRGAVAPPGRDGRRWTCCPDGRIGHIVVADSGRRDRRRAGDRALARRRWPTAWPATS